MAAETMGLQERSWFRYSLGTIFLAVLAVAAWLAYRSAPPVPPVPPGTSIVRVDQIDELVKSLNSRETFAYRFSVGQCAKLGAAAAETLPALKALRARKL